MGVRDDFHQGQQVDYVLSLFPRGELDRLPEIMDRAAEMILAFSTIGIARTMSQYNE